MPTAGQLRERATQMDRERRGVERRAEDQSHSIELKHSTAKNAAAARVANARAASIVAAGAKRAAKLAVDLERCAEEMRALLYVSDKD